MKGGVRVVMRIVGVSELRYAAQARNVMQERRSTFVRGGGEGHVVSELVAGRRPSWKPFARKGCPQSFVTEFRVI